MAEFLSYQHAINTARMSYEKFGFKIEKQLPGQEIYKEFCVDIESSKYAAIFALIDEQLFIIRYFGNFFMGSAFGPNSEEAINHARLNELMISTLTSIRLLCSHGLDTSARTQLRTLYELSLLWSRLLIDTNAFAEFIVSTNPEATNKFWHKYTAKGKTEKYLKENNNLNGTLWALSSSEHMNRIYSGLGPTTHPSFLAAFFDLKASWESASRISDRKVVRDPSDASLFVLSSAFLLAYAPYSFEPCPRFRFKSRPLFDPKAIYPSNEKVEDWSAYCFQLRKVLHLLFLMFTRFVDALEERSKKAISD